MIPHLAIQKKKCEDQGIIVAGCPADIIHGGNGVGSTSILAIPLQGMGNVLFHWARELLLDQTIVIFKSPEGSAAFFP